MTGQSSGAGSGGEPGQQAYQGFRGAGVRLTEQQLPHLSAHRTELLGPSLPAIHAFDKAHLVMLVETGIVDPSSGQAMLRALRTMEDEGVGAARAAAEGGMHSGEHYLIQRLGPDLGGRLHTGRSSGDLIEVARRLTIRGHLHEVLLGLCAVRDALLRLADTHAGSVMPGYTHGQHAQPTTFGHWATMFEQALARDTARVLETWSRVNRSPAGAAILTGTDFPIDRQRVADLLGFDEVIPHTLDAIMSHDLEMEVASTYATCAASLTRLADDLYLWTTSEFAFVELPDRYCGTSSIMPQKKNPEALEDVKSVATQALAALVSVTTAERGPTGFPIMERRHSQDVLWSVGSALAIKMSDLTGMLSDLQVDTERMRKAAGSHWAQVTDLASALTRTGASWRQAHQVVGRFVRMAIDRGETPETVRLDVLDEAANAELGRPSGLDATTFAEAMDTQAFVERRTLLGGPAPSAVRREAGTFRRQLQADLATVEARHARTVAAAGALEEAIDALLAEHSGR